MEKQTKQNNAIENLIIERCRYKKIMGINRFYENDISELLNLAWEQNIDISRKELLEQIGDRLNNIE